MCIRLSSPFNILNRRAQAVMPLPVFHVTSMTDSTVGRVVCRRLAFCRLTFCIACLALAAGMASAADNAAFVSTTGLPSSMKTGETRVVTVRMRNTGTTRWTGSKGYQLGSQSPANNTTWGLKRKAVSGSVAPNGVHSFKLAITAPKKPGTYAFRWRMLRELKPDPLDPNPPVAILGGGRDPGGVTAGSAAVRRAARSR